MDTTIETQLLERITGLLRGEARVRLAQFGLQPVQFEALGYLARCNRYSDTPMGVTDYLGQTKGTVSQSLKVLERNGLIEKMPDDQDRRITHLRVTAQGKRCLKKLSSSVLMAEALSSMNAANRDKLATTLQQLLMGLQAANGFKTFGQCISCQHNLPRANGTYLCNLTQESLSQKETLLICREHLPK